MTGHRKPEAEYRKKLQRDTAMEKKGVHSVLAFKCKGLPGKSKICDSDALTGADKSRPTRPNPNMKTRSPHPKTRTRNMRTRTQHLKTRTRNMKTRTHNMKTHTRNMQTRTLNMKTRNSSRQKLTHHFRTDATYWACRDRSRSCHKPSPRHGGGLGA